MSGKLLTVLVGVALALPVAFAHHGDDPLPFANGQRFGSCAGGGWSCSQDPSGSPFPPDAVTGHTVYASWVMERVRVQDQFQNESLGLPTDFAAIAGFFQFVDAEKERREVARAIQRECVVWFNGMNLDQRPTDDKWGPENSYPSDEGVDPNATHQPAMQDYDFDRDVPNCEPLFEEDVNVTMRVQAGHAGFAVAVEQGDCNPGGGAATGFRYRGHLDFVDPNGIYHEVQEYDYVCNQINFSILGEEISNERVANAVRDFFPETFTDEHNTEGCNVNETPLDNLDPTQNPPGYFDLGHKCNGSIRDLFTERLWITPIHDPVWDPTIERLYNFALQIDTCAGINIYELNGKEAEGEDNDYQGAERLPSGTGTTALSLYHEVAYHTWYGSGLDQFAGDWPLFDVCTDGSSFSFNDTPRGRVVHGGPPQGTGDEEIMRGNSYDFDQGSETFGKHRTNCRVQDMNWPMNTYPSGPPEMGDDCYPEDHKTARVDIWVFQEDPTGLWDAHELGGTGPALFTQPNPTGPDGEPDPREPPEEEP